MCAPQLAYFESMYISSKRCLTCQNGYLTNILTPKQENVLKVCYILLSQIYANIYILNNNKQVSTKQDGIFYIKHETGLVNKILATSVKY